MSSGVDTLHDDAVDGDRDWAMLLPQTYNWPTAVKAVEWLGPHAMSTRCWPLRPATSRASSHELHADIVTVIVIATKMFLASPTKGGGEEKFSLSPMTFRSPLSLKNIKYTKTWHSIKQNSKNFLPSQALRKCFPRTLLWLWTSLVYGAVIIAVKCHCKWEQQKCARWPLTFGPGQSASAKDPLQVAATFLHSSFYYYSARKLILISTSYRE